MIFVANPRMYKVLIFIQLTQWAIYLKLSELKLYIQSFVTVCVFSVLEAAFPVDHPLIGNFVHTLQGY